MSVVRDVTGVLNGLQRICSSGTGLLKSKLQQLARASLSLDTLCRRCNSQNGGIKIDPNWTLRDIPLETHQSNTTPPRASNTTSTPSTPSRKLHTLSFRRCLNSSARPPSSGAVTDNSRHTVEQSAEPTHNQEVSRPRERAVPVSRISRIANFGGLAAGLSLGTAAELTRRKLGLSSEQDDLSPFLTSNNMERIVDTLCRMRGSALKLGQMFSIQDNSLIPEYVQEVFQRVRNNADYMPLRQMEGVLKEELGADWRGRFKSFDDTPIAAASIGQVHRAVLLDGTEVAIKVQYPGVAESIDSDIDNLLAVLNLWNVFPKGLFADKAIAVMRKELSWETDYCREASCGSKFLKLLQEEEGLGVPRVIHELSTRRVLTTDLVEGIPLDQCTQLPQEIRNDVG